MVPKLTGMLLAFVWALQMQAQTTDMFAGTDQQVYVTGEKIWISGMVSGKPDLNETELTVYLFNRQSKVVHRQKLLTNAGYFFTGLQLKGGMLTDNYVVGIFEGGRFRSFIPVMIINPVMAPQNTAAVSTGNQQQRTMVEMRIHVSDSVVTKGSLVTVSVDTPARSMNYFVAVTRADDLSAYADSLFDRWTFSHSLSDLPQVTPGYSVRGKLVDEQGKGVSGISVLASVMAEQAELGFGESGADGAVEIWLPYHHNDLPLVLTPTGPAANKYRVLPELDQEEFAFDFRLPALVLNPGFSRDISERVVNAEVQNKFRKEEKTRLASVDLDTSDFYGKPDKRYILDQYTRFPDMQEILLEIVPEVRMRKPAGKAMLQVSNDPFKVFFDQPALVLLDGIPVTDIDQLLTLDPLKLYCIDVVAKKFFIGKYQMHGVVHYKTYKRDLAGYRLPANELLVEHNGLSLPMIPEYTLSGDPRLPDFRNALFWLPPGKLPTGHFQFSTLDGEGKYRVQVTGIDEKGKVFMGQHTIIVK